jgi:hypothetical protein
MAIRFCRWVKDMELVEEYSVVLKKDVVDRE